MKNKGTKISKIPKFMTYNEEVAFWDTHSVADYLDEFEYVNMSYKPNKSEISSKAKLAGLASCLSIPKLLRKNPTTVVNPTRSRVGLATA